MTGPESARGPQAVAKFLRPRSAAIIGISARAGSTGQVILQSLKANEFRGDIHLVGRSAEPIDGRPVLKSADELPEGVDLAIFTLPAAAVRDAVAACVKRKVGAAMVFAAGFAESGNRDTQEDLARSAREGGLAVVGPNCLGFTNNVDGLMLHMMFARRARRFTEGSRPGVAFVGHSGGMLGHFQRATDARGIPLSYVISTGNEAGLDLADFLEFLADDPATSVIVLYAEQIRRPHAFLGACRRARSASKPVVVLHPGRSAKAKRAALSHTGALAGDYDVMRTKMEAAGALVLNTMDETMDVTEILARFPSPPNKGPGVITASGAFVALTNDFAEEIGLDVPAFQPETLNLLTASLPAFGNYGNPLDVTAGSTADALPIVTKAVFDDPNVGMVFISYPINSAAQVQQFNEAAAGSAKPAVIVALGDSLQHPPDVVEAIEAGPYVFSRSSDRMLRAIGHYTRYGKLLSRVAPSSAPEPFQGAPTLASGAQPEWVGKKLLAIAGIHAPLGDLARTVDEAVIVAGRIGYPVALKAQAALLAHKTEAGGIALNLADESALRQAWETVTSNVRRSAATITLDGCLIEKMAPKGLELMIGAKRDAAWGTVLLLGLGGIWVEALGDVQLLPEDASETEIVRSLHRLRSAKLLDGFRGAPRVDVESVAHALMAIGRLMRTMPELVEIDVNPLVAYARGHGATALDALIVVQ